MSGTSRFKPPDMLLDLELVAPFLDATLRSAIGSAILSLGAKALQPQSRKIWIFENQIEATAPSWPRTTGGHDGGLLRQR